MFETGKRTAAGKAIFTCPGDCSEFFGCDPRRNGAADVAGFLKNGEMLHPLTALFTATSATCVTGLTLVDPYTQFTFFGQAVLLTMIEIGGIGLLTLTNFFMFSLRKKLGLRTLRLAQENTNAGSFHNIRSLLQIIVATTLLIESIGAILLSLRFVPKYGAHGVWVAILLRYQLTATQASTFLEMKRRLARSSIIMGM